MESRVSLPGFSLAALIAEAKRRARQRRLLVALLLLAVAAVAAAVALGSSGGGGSRPGGPSGRLGSGSGGSESVHVGALALTVPRGFYPDKIPCPSRHCPLGDSPIRVLVTNHPLTAADSPTAKRIYPANFVVLDLGYLSAGEIARTRPPLNLHEFRPMGHALGDGTAWSQIVSGRGSSYSVWVFEGNKAPPADRTAVLRALRSIHDAR